MADTFRAVWGFPIVTALQLSARGDRVTITWGRYAAATGLVDRPAFQRTVDCPDEFAPGYHVVLDTDELVTVRWDQVKVL